ncbi:MAG TPA: HAMP domain-containing sensor histidine kinase, partial [Ohtaekwangia sp.]
LDSAEYFIRISDGVGKEFSNEYLSYRSLSDFGKLHFKKEQYDSARFYLKKCIQLSDGKYHSDILVPAMILLVKCHIAEGNWSAAEQQALTAFSLGRQVKSTSISMESTALLAEIYKARKLPLKAIEYLQLSLAFKDSVLTALRQGSIEARTFDLTLKKEKREKEMAVLNLEAQHKVVFWQRFMLALGTIVLISLLIMIILIRKAALERRKVNALLMQKNLELNNLNREVSALIDAIVHDLKSPLNSLQGIMYLLEMEVDEKFTKAREFIAKGHEVIRNGHGIIAELLELRDLEENPLVVKYEQVRLDSYVQSLVNGFSSYASQKKISFEMNVTNEVAILEPLLLKRILDNLISNAIKYSPAERTVFITAGRGAEGVRVEVRDEGPGFHEKDIPKVFGKFQKLSARPTGGESSHGLGLAIVQLIVNYLGGTIELQTKWGEGATFILNVPEQKS